MPKTVVTKSQILHLLTVLVIVPLAGLIASEVAKILPIHFDATQLTAIFVAGAGSALTAGIHYLHGLQLWERNVAPIVDVQDDTPTPPTAHTRRRTSTKPVT